jgi:CBS domain-containing protein
MIVKEIMIKQKATITAESRVTHAAKIMKAKRMGALPVIRSPDRLGGTETIGMVTDRDIVLRTVAEDKNPFLTTVAEIMTPEIHCCKEDATVERALEIMTEKQVHRLVVIDMKGLATAMITLKELIPNTGNTRRVSRVIENSLSL